MKNKRFTKKRLFEIIQIGQGNDRASRIFDLVLVLAVILNISVLFLETFDSLKAFTVLFRVTEGVTVAFFIVEYVLRIWTAEFLYPGLPKSKAVMHFLVSFDGIVDLCTILPVFFLSGFVVFRMLRVVRIFHLFRINTRYDSFNVIFEVFSEKRKPLLSSVFIIMILMFSSSLCMYNVEHKVQPEAFKNAFSGLWWSVSTISTVGYGDIYPVTVAGRVLAVIITFLGIGVVAIPTGIISAGFVEHYTKLQRDSEKTARACRTLAVNIDTSSVHAGQRVEDVEAGEGISIAAIVRDGAVLLPDEGVLIKPDDTVIYQRTINRDREFE
ncbi:MAG: ion transporter [Lachnospiraceae bacterium]|nr:ion transporter [Lachnospiraceae bacterium]